MEYRWKFSGFLVKIGGILWKLMDNQWIYFGSGNFTKWWKIVEIVENKWKTNGKQMEPRWKLQWKLL